MKINNPSKRQHDLAHRKLKRPYLPNDIRATLLSAIEYKLDTNPVWQDSCATDAWFARECHKKAAVLSSHAPASKAVSVGLCKPLGSLVFRLCSALYFHPAQRTAWHVIKACWGEPKRFVYCFGSSPLCCPGNIGRQTAEMAKSGTWECFSTCQPWLSCSSASCVPACTTRICSSYHLLQEPCLRWQSRRSGAKAVGDDAADARLEARISCIAALSF